MKKKQIKKNWIRFNNNANKKNHKLIKSWHGKTLKELINLFGLIALILDWFNLILKIN